MGLPFITSSEDLSFEKNFKYLYKIESNDDVFDIDKVLEWYQSIYNYDYKKEMRKYASKYLEYEYIYKNIFKKIK